jgi:hypothetical protein
VSDFHYPIVNNIDHVVVAGSPDYAPQKYKSVGMVVAQTYWRSMIRYAMSILQVCTIAYVQSLTNLINSSPFRNILPKRSTGIHVVVTNPCVDAFGYRIDGPNVTYLGAVFHNTERYKIKKESKLHELGAWRRSEYSGAKLNTDYCTSTVVVHGSDEMKARFTSNNPLIFSFAVLFIFAFTSLVFYVYDRKVERRQQAVLETATR